MTERLVDLDEIFRTIRWSRIERRLAGAARERAVAAETALAFQPIVLLRATLLQSWYGLSDSQLVRQLERDLVFRRFLGLNSREAVPGVACLERFRHEFDEDGTVSQVIARLQQGVKKAGMVLAPGELVVVDPCEGESDKGRQAAAGGEASAQTMPPAHGHRSGGAERYDKVTRSLHWVFATTIIYITISGYLLPWIDSWSHAAHRFVAHFNVSLATLLTLLFPFRVIWMHLRNELPPVPGTSEWQHRAAKLAHSLIYISTGVVLVSGYLMIPGGYHLFGLVAVPTPFEEGAATRFFFSAHRVSCAMLALLVVMHVLAVVQHYVAHHVNIVRRMI